MSPFQSLLWYPPAEARQPVADILAAALIDNDEGSGGLAASIRQQTGARHCLLACNARSLLFLLLKQLDARSGGLRREVVIPGYTCYTVASSIAKAGLTIRTYDLDPHTLQADPDAVRAAINDDTLAVVSQHLFGILAAVDPIQELARGAGVFHIEDAAQAFGSCLNGVPAGRTGDYGLYSFGRGKGLPVGAGGALVSDDDSIMEIDPGTSPAGRKAFSTSLVSQVAISPLLYWLPEMLPLGLGETEFDTSFTPTAIPEFVGRLARRRLSHLPDEIARRRGIADVYAQELDHGQLKTASGAEFNLTRYPVLAGNHPIPTSLRRLGVRRMYPRAIVDANEIHPYLGSHPEPASGSRYIAANLLTLPTHRGISMWLASEIAGAVNTWMRARTSTS